VLRSSGSVRLVWLQVSRLVWKALRALLGTAAVLPVSLTTAGLALADESIYSHSTNALAEDSGYKNIAPVERPRPRSLADQTPLPRVMNAGPGFAQFVGHPNGRVNTTGNNATPDPRLPRAGNPRNLSDYFLSQVGADPWSLSGIGFPNIETHRGAADASYKPYHALIDWHENTAQDGWTPVPAVYCMGLSAGQIAQRASTHERQILEYGQRYGVSPSLIKAVITKESCFDTQAISTAGAEGLMQLMPETARWLDVTDRADVDQNLAAGIRYLADLRDRFGSEELALAAYNAGPGNVERHGGIPPFQETQQYVKSVMAHYRSYVATSRYVNRNQPY